ncbi:Ankyrin repeat family protein / regulator of chromosome condensation [Hirschfeldia incana]|nr:Ankyrin repeat family protein / regulator of chromosome condensation [Hirschfeldia incana]
MEVSVSPQTHKTKLQTPRKSSLSGAKKDLWVAIREGSLVDVESALNILKKNCGILNLRNACGLTPLHVAIWRNHIPIVKRLLAAGADPDARDGESGWSSLHRALHFGHLAVASVLIDSGASFTLEDIKSRTPVDLVSGPVAQVIGEQHNSVATEVFSWGNGANYQLGTGNQDVQKLPGRVDSLHGCFIKSVSAAKFHSVAISSHGEVYTWGFGRGGRLGHPEFDIHSGQAAVITPRKVITGLVSRRVKAVAAAKHHTVIATETGDVLTWGSNREGQLGYTSVDTQATPRKVTSLKAKIVAVSAANKHTAVVSDCGEVFTWGCNKEGQLGYGTSNSASNYFPRLVDYLKGKVFTAISSAKYHTLVLREDGEVYTWGHRLVTPRRVVVSRNLKKAGNTLLNFHRRRPLKVTAIAAGMVHSMALAEDGAVFYWVSSDSSLKSQQLHSLQGKTVVSISAGKYWASAATSTGEVYMWDGKTGKDVPPSLSRIHNLKRATTVAVGETHLMVVASLYHPTYAPAALSKYLKVQADETRREQHEELDEGFMFDDVESVSVLPSAQHDNNPKERTAPSLKSLCEKVAAECIVEPRNAIQLLEIADSLGAHDLKKYCEDLVIRNLDFILTVSPQTIANTSPDVLANLEKLLDDRSSEAWSSRPLPTPTATFPVVIDSEEEESESDILRTRDNHVKPFSCITEGASSFLQPEDELAQRNTKEVRALRKKLQQIEILEAKLTRGQALDDQQIAKLQKKLDIEISLVELGISVEESPEARSSSLDGKANKKAEGLRKKKKKGKQRFAQVETFTDLSEVKVEIDTMQKEETEESSETVNAMLDVTMVSEFTNEADSVSHLQKKDNPPDSPRSKKVATKANKKKNRKGGLSMFLTGALDDNPKPVVAPPPPKPKNEGPAWGGAAKVVSKGYSSLRDIQDEQSKTPQPHEPVRTTTKHQLGDESRGKTEGKILLSSFLTSKPIPVESTRSLQQSDMERGTPPWASSATPPHVSRPSLRDIQMQQVKKQQSLSHSPKTKTSGFTVTTGQGSPSDSPGANRWFKPEIDAPSSIRSIQVEEKAMKDLRRFYSSVKVVRNQN